jgi:hypothetical protein
MRETSIDADSSQSNTDTSVAVDESPCVSANEGDVGEKAGEEKTTEQLTTEAPVTDRKPSKMRAPSKVSKR